MVVAVVMVVELSIVEVKRGTPAGERQVICVGEYSRKVASI